MNNWQTEQPWRQSLISDGTTLWHYEPDLEQVVVRAVDPALQHTPSLLFGGDLAALSTAFEVQRVDLDAAGDSYRLQPRMEGSLFASLTIQYRGSAIAGLTLVDAFGQRTLITFSDLDQDTVPPADRFTFVVPDGVDVLRDD